MVILFIFDDLSWNYPPITRNESKGRGERATITLSPKDEMVEEDEMPLPNSPPNVHSPTFRVDRRIRSVTTELN